MRGPADFTVPADSTMSWSNTLGTSSLVGPGNFNILAGGTVNVTTPALKRIDNRTVNNAGTLTNLPGTLGFQLNGSTFNNQARGVFDFHDDQSIGGFPDCTFHNAGTVRKSGGSGLAAVYCAFHSTHRVEATVGMLEVGIGGMSSGTFHADGGTIVFGTQTFAAGAAFTGPGLFLVRGTVTLNTDVSVPRLEMSHPGGNPEINGSGALTITNTFDFLRGRLLGTGRITIREGATLNVAGGPTGGGKTIGNRALDNFGWAIFTEGYGASSGFLFTNQPTGVVVIVGNPSCGGTFSNLGFFLKVGAGQATLDAFSNDGGYAGLFEGTLAVGRPYVQTDGFTQMFDGTTLRATAGVDLRGGFLLGSGTIVGNVTNNAWIEVGSFGATGVLRIEGTYRQTASGVLSLELGGMMAGSGHDQLDITGAATLDGFLLVSLLPGYMPNPADPFVVVRWASRQGEFAVLVLPDGMSASYGTNGLTVTA